MGLKRIICMCILVSCGARSNPILLIHVLSSPFPAWATALTAKINQCAECIQPIQSTQSTHGIINGFPTDEIWYARDTMPLIGREAIYYSVCWLVFTIVSANVQPC